MIYIVDYGLGNLASIKNMFKHIDIRDVRITSDKTELEKADKIILPGVGAFDNGMEHLQKHDLIDVLNKLYHLKNHTVEEKSNLQEIFIPKLSEILNIGIFDRNQ